MWSIASIRVPDSSAIYADHRKAEMRFSSSNRVMVVGYVQVRKERLFKRILPFSLL
jgi:hypothetical protein